MRVITSVSSVPYDKRGLRLTVSNVSIPGHPYYEVDIVPAHAEADVQSVFMSWESKKKDVWVADLISAINLAMEDDGTEADDDESVEVDMDLFGYDYVDGRNARRAGKSLNDCPSLKGSMEGKAWIRGWKDRRDDESKGE